MPDPHPPSAELATTTVWTLAHQLRTAERDGRAVTDALRDRIDAVDAVGGGTALRAVLALADDAPRCASERDVERADGRIRGPLHGVPVLVKDNIEALGLPASAGSLALAGRPPTRDSPLVGRLRDAGAVILGSTNLSEWANFRSPHSTSGWSAVGGLTGNPWALDRSAGGSSSGSGAAVAAGLAPVAIGTETNGSITCPAALNGVVGLKPTVGSVPGAGIVPVSRSQDVAGPLARSVRDVALVYEVMAKRADCVSACTASAAAVVRVGVVEQWLTGHAATDALFGRTVDVLAGAVALVRTVAVPAMDFGVHHDQVTVLVGEIVDDLDAYLTGRHGDGVRTLVDVVAFNRAHAARELSGFGQEYFEQAVTSGGRSADAYRQARERNLSFARDDCLGPALAAPVDVLIAPAYQPAWKSDLTLGDLLDGGGAVCTPAAILGWPILTVPMGLVDGLPVALSIVGPAGSEPTLLAVGHALEVALERSAGPFPSPSWQPPSRG